MPCHCIALLAPVHKPCKCHHLDCAAIPTVPPGTWSQGQHAKLVAEQASHLPAAGPSDPRGSLWRGLSFVTMAYLIAKVSLHSQKVPVDISLSFMEEASAFCS